MGSARTPRAVFRALSENFDRSEQPPKFLSRNHTVESERMPMFNEHTTGILPVSIFKGSTRSLVLRQPNQEAHLKASIQKLETGGRPFLRHGSG
jgi:hypothetical protein